MTFSDPLEPLEPRRLLSGVTVVTHGYNGNTTGWVSRLADVIVDRAGGSSAAAESTMTVGYNSNDKLAITAFDGFTNIAGKTRDELVIKLDWADISDGRVSTGDVAAVVAKYLLSPGRGGGAPLASKALHFIGHSRGASLNVALADNLGKSGVWVEQNTFLDPHPVDGVNDLFNVSFGDTKMHVSTNVIFSDNYWRTDGDTQNQDVDGELVTGSADFNQNATVQQNFFVSAHEAITSYYIGTADLTTTTGGDHPVIPSWYSGNVRSTTGYAFSRLFATAKRPLSGVSTAFGGTASRTPITVVGPQYANIANFQILGTSTVRAGTSIRTQFAYADPDSTAKVSFLIDVDRNPDNNNFSRTAVRDHPLAQRGTPTTVRLNGGTTGMSAGTYFLCARIIDAQNHVRYVYADRAMGIY